MSDKRKSLAPESVNHSKIFMQKILIAALTLIIGLVATVWAITWDATVKRQDRTDATVKENTQVLIEMREFVAKQTIINENTLRVLEELKKK